LKNETTNMPNKEQNKRTFHWTHNLIIINIFLTITLKNRIIFFNWCGCNEKL